LFDKYLLNQSKAIVIHIQGNPGEVETLITLVIIQSTFAESCHPIIFINDKIATCK